MDRRTTAVSLGLTLLLAGCGGGGGGGAASVGPSAQGPTLLGRPPIDGGAGAPPGVIDTAEYRANWGLAAVKADSAYARGATGDGVTVAVIDSGIDLTHPEFAGQLHPGSRDMVARPAPSLQDVGGHGTKVAGVVAANRDGAGMHGLAYDGRILALRADAEGSCTPNCTFWHSDLATATTYAVTQGAHVLNYSLGGDGLGSPFADALANAAANDRILVFAAGNSAGADPLSPASWSASAEARGLALAVGAVDQANSLAWFSNKAGSAKDFFLVAPGVGIATTDLNGGYATVNGTSFSAPHVSGAAAVLLSLAPHLTSRQVVELMLSTATDLGDPGTDAVYGRGMLNLDAALSPQGPVTLAQGATVAEGGAPAAGTSLALGAAFGDALRHSPVLARAVGFDSYGRAYGVDLAGALAPAAQSSPLAALVDTGVEARRLGLSPTPGSRLGLVAREGDGDTPSRIDRFQFAQDWQGVAVAASSGYGLNAHLGLAALGSPDPANLPGAPGFASPYLALAGSDGFTGVLGTGLGNGLTLRFGGQERAAAAELSKDWGRLVTSLSVGSLAEERGPLDSRGQGAFAFGDGADTRFLGLSARLDMGAGWDLFGQYSTGWTSFASDKASLLRDVEGVRSDSFGLGLGRSDLWALGDRLSVGLSRPLKVTDGGGVLDIPVGRTLDGQVIRAAERVSLTPSGTEWDATVGYSLPLGEGEDLGLSYMLRLEPGHDAEADPEHLMGLRYRLRF